MGRRARRSRARTGSGPSGSLPRPARRWGGDRRHSASPLPSRRLGPSSRGRSERGEGHAAGGERSSAAAATKPAVPLVRSEPGRGRGDGAGGLQPRAVAAARGPTRDPSPSLPRFLASSFASPAAGSVRRDGWEGGRARGQAAQIVAPGRTSTAYRAP